RLLARATLASARALFDGLVASAFATREELARAALAVERLESLLDSTERPVEAVEPAFYEWYFRGIDYLKRRQFAELAGHAGRASAVAAMRLIRAAALDEDLGEPLDIDLLDDGRLILSEREPPEGAAPVVGPLARLVTRGSTLRVQPASGHAIEVDWQEL